MKPVRYTPALINRFITRGFWTEETLVGIWEKNAATYPENEAIVDGKSRLTWRQAKKEIDELAEGLIALGIARDEVVIGQLPNSVESVTLRLATEKAGILYLPGSLAWRQKEVEHIVNTLKAVGAVIPSKYEGFDYGKMYEDLKARLPTLKHLIFWDNGGPSQSLSLRQSGQKASETTLASSVSGRRIFGAVETSCINATSGTTGLPKLVESATAPTVLFGKVVAKRLGITAQDVVASVGPVHWGSGVGAVYSGAPQKGAKLVLLETFNPEDALALIETEKVTVAAGSTAQLIAMVRSPAFERKRLATLRAFYWAGAPLPYAIGREAEEKTDCMLVSAYGAMDAGYFSCGSVEDSSLVRNMTVGKPLDGNEAIIVDDGGRKLPKRGVGEIWFRGACCFPGYFRDKEAVRQAWGRRGLRGWYRTGDVGQMDADGNIRVLGRIKDVIHIDGKPVYPAEVENALMAHPKIQNAAIVNVPEHERARCVAFVIPKSGKKLSYEEMVDHLRKQGLGDYKIPSRLEIRERFPMAGDGLKISRKDLEAEAKALSRAPY